jgi:hypothetical protein
MPSIISGLFALGTTVLIGAVNLILQNHDIPAAMLK